MLAYNFQDEFEPDLKSGVKTLTLRRPRDKGPAHAQVGAPIGLWCGLRTKAARRIGVGLVEVRGLLLFNANGIKDFTDRRLIEPHSLRAADLDQLVLQYDADSFAIFDGFASYAALWQWHDAHRDKGETGAVLARELIAWRPLTADQIAELDAGRAQLESV